MIQLVTATLLAFPRLPYRWVGAIFASVGYVSVVAVLEPTPSLLDRVAGVMQAAGAFIGLFGVTAVQRAIKSARDFRYPPPALLDGSGTGESSASGSLPPAGLTQSDLALWGWMNDQLQELKMKVTDTEKKTLRLTDKIEKTAANWKVSFEQAATQGAGYVLVGLLLSIVGSLVGMWT